MSKPDVSSLIQAFIRIRDEKDALKKKFDRELAELTRQQNLIEEELHRILKESGAQSISCDCGTAFVSTKSTARVADWNALFEYIQRTGKYELLAHAVNKSVVESEIEATGELVPGVDFCRILNVNVRRK